MEWKAFCKSKNVGTRKKVKDRNNVGELEGNEEKKNISVYKRFNYFGITFTLSPFMGVKTTPKSPR